MTDGRQKTGKRFLNLLTRPEFGEKKLKRDKLRAFATLFSCNGIQLNIRKCAAIYQLNVYLRVRLEPLENNSSGAIQNGALFAWDATVKHEEYQN